MKTFSIRSFVVLFAIFVTASAAISQRPDFNRARTYDVQHYAISVSFDHKKRTVFGDTIVELKPLADGFRTAVLDARDLKFESVTLDGKTEQLVYRTSPGKVTVTLDRDYKKDESIKFRFKYSATPKKGIYFVDAKSEKDGISHSDQIWTQGEPEEAHHWFPSFDFPSDKATSETLIRVPVDMTVIGNGELVGGEVHDDGTKTIHHIMSRPHPTYLISFIVGKYTKKEEEYKGISLGYYMYPGTEFMIEKAYGKTVDMLRIHEELTGIGYPFAKYDQTIVANFQFGGMENITATTMADTEIFAAQTPFLQGLIEDLVAHEIAHSWFGNNVTMNNWAELWLNEGFATFMEAAVREKLYGRRDYLRKIGVNADEVMADEAAKGNPFALFNLNAGNVDKLFDRPAITYSKGSVVVHMLREQVGDANFWKAVNIYLTRHRFANTETPDLIRAMEEASGQKLDWFFEQWVYGTSHPKLSITQRYDDAKKEMVFDITQTQKGRLTPQAFRLPLEVAFLTAPPAGSEAEDSPDPLASAFKTAVLDITQRKQTIRVPVEQKPARVAFDPNARVPLIAIKAQSRER